MEGWLQKAKSKPNLLRRSWQAAGAGGVEGCLGEHLAERGQFYRLNMATQRRENGELSGFGYMGIGNAPPHVLQWQSGSSASKI